LTRVAEAKPVRSTTVPFEEQATHVLRRLRAAVSAVIQAIPGAHAIQKAADLQRALDIRATLAWQMYRLAYAADPLPEGSTIPGTGAMNRFFEAAVARGVPKTVAETARQAVREFKGVVQAHAGDRSAFDSMISSIGGKTSAAVDLQHKRAAYKANSHIWGVRAKTQLSCMILRPSPSDPERVDMLGVRGLIGLRRLRPNATWEISRSRQSESDGRVLQRHDPKRAIPIDPPGADDTPGFSLLQGFCSQPLPRFKSVCGPSGFASVELEPTDIGNKAAVTCVFADVFPAFFARYCEPDDPDPVFTSHSMVRTPCEVLVHDVMIAPAVLWEPAEPLVYSDLRTVDPAPGGRERDLLPTSASVVHLGKGPDVLSSPDVPRYVEMVRYALDRAGWDGRQFEVYRCRVEFPVMPSSVMVRFEMPQRPIRPE
jgi:hypothetical protein